MPRRCIFCGSVADSREHVWPYWFGKLFSDSGTFIIEDTMRPEVPKRSEETLNLVVRCVCTLCNNGWMAELEGTVKPHLLPMLDGGTMHLAGADQTIIATWAMKTALILAQTGPRTSKRFYRDSDAVAFRQNTTPLPNTYIWLARYWGTKAAIGSCHVLARGTPPAEPKPTHIIEGHEATFSVRQLALQVFTFRPGGRPPDVGNPETWSPAMIPIWPVLGAQVWPPKLALDDDGIERFSLRFGRAEESGVTS